MYYQIFKDDAAHSDVGAHRMKKLSVASPPPGHQARAEGKQGVLQDRTGARSKEFRDAPTFVGDLRAPGTKCPAGASPSKLGAVVSLPTKPPEERRELRH